MKRLRCSFLIVAVFCAGVANLPAADFSVNAVGFGTLASVQAESWPQIVQTAWAGGLALEAPLPWHLGLGVQATYLYAWGTVFVSGVQYRGYQGLDARAWLRWDFTMPEVPVVSEYALSAGPVMRYVRQNLVPIYHYYLGVFVEPQVEFELFGFKPLRLRLGLPFDLFLRPDYNLHAAMGLNLSLRFLPFAGGNP